MIQVQLKLKLRPAQERQLERWLWRLTGLWNWAVRKLEADARDGKRLTAYDFHALLKGHSTRLEIPRTVLRGTTDGAVLAWRRYGEGSAGRPKLKGRRNRLNSVPFKDHVFVRAARVKLSGLEPVRFHRQAIPDGAIKTARIVKRASGWYLCLFIDAAPRAIPRVADGAVGIDPGFSSLLMLSTGEKIEHPHELRAGAERLAQAQRGKRKRLTARLQERQGNRRKDRNHKLSRRLISENILIAWSEDRTRAIARRFGKSVGSAGHYQLRKMLEYKSRLGDVRFIAVPSQRSTRICSACGTDSGPRGLAELSVRQWVCTTCGVEHDRDRNAALNTLIAACGTHVESGREAALGIAS